MAKGHCIISFGQEEWRPVLGCPGYEISRTGRIKTCRSINGRGPLKNEWREIHPFLSYGYRRVNLPGRIHASLAVLLLEAFVGPRPPGMLARHLNDIHDDNRLENLAWGTDADNKQDAIRNGRTGKGKKRGPRPPEVRLKISEAHKGKKLSAEHRYKIGIGGRGKKRSEESRRRMSLAQMGNKKFLGHRHTEETRLKMSLAQKSRKKSQQFREEKGLSQ